MTFPGRFSDSLVVDQLDKISLSFLVEDLDVRRGGVAANIAFGMGCLGLQPVLVGAVGRGLRRLPLLAGAARRRLPARCTSPSCGTPRGSSAPPTPTTPRSPSFYAGAMSEARDIELGPVAARVGGLDLVVIGANDPEAMLRHTEECRTRGYPFAADPSPAAGLDGRRRRSAGSSTGPTYLFTNEYEAALTEQKTGWSARGDPRARRHPRHHHGARTAPSSSARARRRSQVAVRPRGAQGRPDRRRRRLPRRLPRRPGLGAGPPSAAPRSARCWRPTSSRPSAPRSTSWAAARSSTGSPTLRRGRRPPRSRRTVALPAPLTGPCAARARSSPPPSPWRLTRRRSVDRRRGPGRGRRRPRAGHAAGGLPRRPVPDGRSGADGGPPLGWWSPDPRGVLPLDGLRVSRSLRRRCRTFEIAGRHRLRRRSSRACADPGAGRALDHPRDRARPTPSCTGSAGRTRSRPGADGELVGGLYGLAVGGLFAGESMFHHGDRRLQGGAGRAGRARLRRRRPPTPDRRAVAHRRTWRRLGVVRGAARGLLPASRGGPARCPARALARCPREVGRPGRR